MCFLFSDRESLPALMVSATAMLFAPFDEMTAQIDEVDKQTCFAREGKRELATADCFVTTPISQLLHLPTSLPHDAVYA